MAFQRHGEAAWVEFRENTVDGGLMRSDSIPEAQFSQQVGALPATPLRNGEDRQMIGQDCRHCQSEDRLQAEAAALATAWVGDRAEGRDQTTGLNGEAHGWGGGPKGYCANRVRHGRLHI